MLGTLRRSPGAVLLVATLAIFTDSLLYGLIIPNVPSYLEDPNPAAAGILISAYGAAILVSTPVFGVLVDRAGTRGTMIFGLFGLAAATLLFGMTRTLPLLVLGRILQGTACAATAVASLALIASRFDGATRGPAMGTWTAGNAMGSLIGPPLGGLLYERFGPFGPLVFGAGLATLDGVARALLVTSDAPAQARPSLRAFLRRPSVIDVCVIAVVGASALTFLEAILPLILQNELGASPVTTGLFFAGAAVAFGATSPVVGALERRLGRLRVSILGVFTLALVLPALGRAHTMTLVAISVVLVGVAVGLVITPAMSALAEAVDEEGTGTYGVAYALFNTAFALGMTAGPLAGTTLVQSFGAGVALSAIGALLFVVAAALHRRWRARAVLPTAVELAA